MKAQIAIGSLLILFIRSNITSAFDNVTTHPKITEGAVKQSVLKRFPYLHLSTAFSSNYDSLIRGRKIIDWLKQGSTDEDSPMCRASNHFHDPLLSWNTAYMSDNPWWIDVYCVDWKPLYSDITWFTGYLSQPPSGSKVSFSYYSSAGPNI